MGVRCNAWSGSPVLRRQSSAAARASCQLMFIFPRRTGPGDQPLSRFSAVRFELAILLNRSSVKKGRHFLQTPTGVQARVTTGRRKVPDRHETSRLSG